MQLECDFAFGMWSIHLIDCWVEHVYCWQAAKHVQFFVGSTSRSVAPAIQYAAWNTLLQQSQHRLRPCRIAHIEDWMLLCSQKIRALFHQLRNWGLKSVLQACSSEPFQWPCFVVVPFSIPFPIFLDEFMDQSWNGFRAIPWLIWRK